MQNLTETGSATGSAPGGGFTVPGSAIGGTAGSVLFINPNDTVTQDNSNFYFNSTGKWLGLGTTPAAKLHMSSSFSSPAWTTSGILIRQDAATLTDTSSTGTVPNLYVNFYGIPTLAASSATTYSAAFGSVFSAPVAGTNVTVSNAYAILSSGRMSVNSSSSNAFIVGNGVGSAGGFGVDGGNGRIGVGLGTAPTGKIHCSGNSSLSSWTTAGAGLRFDAQTFTDTSTAASGTVTLAGIHAFATPTIASTNATVTYTSAATVYIANAPANGTNVSVTNKYALYVAAGQTYLGGGRVGGRTAVADAPYTILNSDHIVAYSSLTATRAVTLPASPVVGQEHIITDEAGTAGTNNITFVGTIDGVTNKAITANYGTLSIYYTGTAWKSF